MNPSIIKIYENKIPQKNKDKKEEKYQ